MTDQLPTLLGLLLDKSGSMSTIVDDTIGGFNSYKNAMKEGANGNVLFTLVQFDSHGFEKHHVMKKIEEVPDLDRHSYVPRGNTPLFDSIAKMIYAVEKQWDAAPTPRPLVMIVIQTDGEENSSVEYTIDTVKALITSKQDLGWQFVFLGCGIDAYATGALIGVNVGQTMSYARGSTQSAFTAVASSNRRYTTSGAVGQSMFTDDEKLNAGDPTVIPGNGRSSGGSGGAPATAGQFPRQYPPSPVPVPPVARRHPRTMPDLDLSADGPADNG